MKQFDVFNGDADGICALHQMRLVAPIDSELITGIKRDIQLVKQVNAKAGDKVLVLDISLSKNIDDIKALLGCGCHIQYFDHHISGDIPEHELLDVHINTSSEVCTSLIVNGYLNNQYVLWAIVGAYGDNMSDSADALANSENLNADQKLALQELGIFLNYNGYGGSLDDLHFKPDDLYRAIKPYSSPFDFIEKEPVFKVLKAGYYSDMRQAKFLVPINSSENTAIVTLPNEKWCRRVSGVFGNDLSNQFPERAHAILTEIGSDTYQVSVRAPQINKSGAGVLCSQFETGGGREGAAGINRLPLKDKERFIDAFVQQYAAK